MALREILIYGHPTLRVRSPKVENFDDNLKRVSRDMVETMHNEPGIGLAANQINVQSQIAVIDLSVGEDPNALLYLVNPEVVEREGSQIEEEGCLSIPGINATIQRPFRVTVIAQNLDGKHFKVTGEGLMARALCHEIDHINGILFTDYLKGINKRLIQKKLNRIASACH